MGPPKAVQYGTDHPYLCRERPPVKSRYPRPEDHLRPERDHKPPGNGMKQKKKRKKIRYKVIKIKLTTRQKKSLDNFCKSRKTTPNKLIKKSIRHFLENYHGLEINHEEGKHKQLERFEQEG
jgi:hypothetical protein